MPLTKNCMVFLALSSGYELAKLLVSIHGEMNEILWHIFFLYRSLFKKGNRINSYLKVTG